MPTRHTRSLPAVLLIVAGALTIVGELVAGIPMPSGNWYLWTYLLSYLALAVALVLLATSFPHRFGRLWLFLAAAGWAVYGLSAASGSLQLLASLGGLVAIVFGILAGVVVFRRRFFTPRASSMFLTTSIVGAVFLLFPITLLAFAFGAALIVTGVFMQRRR